MHFLRFIIVFSLIFPAILFASSDDQYRQPEFKLSNEKIPDVAVEKEKWEPIKKIQERPSNDRSVASEKEGPAWRVPSSEPGYEEVLRYWDSDIAYENLN